ncbi:polysaccharide biosynthesis tyrosine autokinase [Flavobacterium sp.]|uniref:GumC family protein n=1 Tax=Flavobacterium sp. TaxID=239 RepID=UPI00286B74F0|nr:polysaccharide biosynthesis tyrosine autokinase [Flavobacterium sp.]
MQENNSFLNSNQEDSFDFRDMVESYVVQWKWFVFGVFVCLVFATLYLRYVIPIYSATATILVKDEKKGGLQSELAAFSDLGISTGVKNNVDNEIEVIKSRRIIKKVIQKLNFNVTYITEGRVKAFEQYNDKPIEFTFYDTSEKFYTTSRGFTINSIDKNHFELLSGNQSSMGKYSYGSIIDLNDAKLVVNKTVNGVKNSDDFSINVNVNNVENVTENYRGRLDVSALNKNSSVVALTINDPLKDKAVDFLNMLIEVYNEDAIADKKFISESTLSFIQNRLKIISTELGDVEKDVEGFKKTNKITDIASQANLYLSSSVNFEKELIDTETQIKVVDVMIDYIKTKGKWDLVPNNILQTADSKITTDFISQYNEMIIQRNRIYKEGTPKNSFLINLEQRIEDISNNIIANLERTKTALNINKSIKEKQNSLIKGKISEIPTQELESRVLDRQQKIKESLYLYLLQKREETAISLAVTAPISKLVDAAYSSSAPVSPKRNIIFFMAFALGILIPFSIIYIKNLFDNKINNRQDIDGKISAPFLGDIPKSESQDEIINTNSKSSSAEAIRIIRTNMEFMFDKIPDNKSKTIFITSTIPKEGKTFVAINLASTIALSGKKVLLIGLDIRNPKIDRYVKLPSKGLTNYLSKNNEDIHDYIVKLDDFENFYVLPSGIVPPNPVDLLMNNRIDEMFEQVKKEYDYIIVDTAPVNLVTDTLLVAKNADIFIYVIRANFLDKRLIKTIESIYRDKKLPNMAVLLNDTKWRKTYGYGYGYGYGYSYIQEEDKKPWYLNWFKK